MMQRNRKFLYVIAGVVAVGFMISSCGRRGALQPPMTTSAADESEDIGQSSKTIKKLPPKSDKPFILDGLI